MLQAVRYRCLHRCSEPRGFVPVEAHPFFSKLPAAFLSENVIPVFRKLSRGKPRHVFYQPQYRNIYFITPEHSNAFYGISQCNLLWCADYNSTGNRNFLNKGKMNITRTGRQVKKQKIELPPVTLKYQLFKEIGCHRASPDNCISRINKKTGRKYFNSEFI